jgi:hypothetical protein
MIVPIRKQPLPGVFGAKFMFCLPPICPTLAEHPPVGLPCEATKKRSIEERKSLDPTYINFNVIGLGGTWHKCQTSYCFNISQAHLNVIHLCLIYIIKKKNTASKLSIIVIGSY